MDQQELGAGRGKRERAAEGDNKTEMRREWRIQKETQCASGKRTKAGKERERVTEREYHTEEIKVRLSVIRRKWKRIRRAKKENK